MTSFFSFLRQKKAPSRADILSLIEGPLTWVKVVFYINCFLILATFYTLLISINNKFIVTIPAKGGEVTEGVIGAPRFINPILAATDTDKALTNLVYRGLMKEEPNSDIAPELAREYSVSPDGKTYTFILHENVKFSDKKILTTSDVLFTLQKLQDSTLNEDTASYWQNISAEIINTNQIVFNLPYPDENFISRMTFGILPRHIWETIDSTSFTNTPYNQKPVGTGAFKISRIKQKNGVISEIDFTRNKHYQGTKPYIHSLIIKVFANQQTLADALKSGAIDTSTALTPETIHSIEVPRSFKITPIPTANIIGIYRHTSETLLANSSFTQVLNNYVDKNAILAKVENGYGTPSTSPNTIEETTLEDTLASLSAIGYTYTNGTLIHNSAPVGFAISVENDPKLLKVAQALAEQLGSLGMIVSIKGFDQGKFQDEVIAGRPNIILVKSTSERVPPNYRPALLLYTEAIPYVTHTQVRGITPERLNTSTLRYENIGVWYRNTDKVWKWFVQHSKSELLK
jgi:peptide/nickel transport system substrate-binding protein